MEFRNNNVFLRQFFKIGSSLNEWFKSKDLVIYVKNKLRKKGNSINLIISFYIIFQLHSLLASLWLASKNFKKLVCSRRKPNK